MIGVNSMSNLQYKGYECSVELDDDKLIGKVLGLKKTLILCEGRSVKEIKKDFQDAIDEHLAECKAEGVEPERPYKGSFNVRVGPENHRNLAMEAMENGVTLNKMLTNILNDRYAI